jgi:hypothetical protein
MHEWRKTLVDELFSHMRVRNIAIATLGRRGADEETREICFGALQNRKQLIMEKEEELLKLEKLLSSHVAVFEFADSAYTEIVQKIKMLDTVIALFPFILFLLIFQIHRSSSTFLSSLPPKSRQSTANNFM